MSYASLLDVFVDPFFFESIDRYVPKEEDFLATVKGLLRGEWVFSRRTVWFGCTPPEGRARDLPMQGWKIHVSCMPSNAVDILKAVVPILDAYDVSFKFALDSRILTMMNGKNWARQGAGKFITVYPVGEEQFIFLLKVIHKATRQFEGLYILSDRRYKDSKVLFYRYGGIKQFAVANEKGEEVSMLISPTGEKVRDERKPFFHLPDWVRDPFEDDYRNESSCQDDAGRIALKDGRYLVKNVLGFSNSGGIYIADDTATEQEVVIKEARPFVTYTEDSISLLKKEFRILTKIADADVAPRPVDFFQDWEHYFLVQDFVKGMPLTTFAAINNVTLKANPTLEDVEKYFADFKAIFVQLASILKILHEHNVVFSDLSPNNLIILTDPLRVRIIDFEGAFEVDIDKPAFLFTPGFAYRDQMYGGMSTFESDYFSLGAVMHYFLAPINQIFVITPRSRFTFLKSVIEDIGFPESIREMIVALIENDAGQRPKPKAVVEILERQHQLRPPAFSSDDERDNPAYQSYVDGICDYALALADYERKDRLFPAFAKIFHTNPLSLSYGACGIAHAIRTMGREVPERVVEWILQPTKNRDSIPPGLYIGLSGIAWTMLDLGRCEEAKRILALSQKHPLLHEAADLLHGVAGWGLANLRFFLALQDELYLRNATEAGEFLLKSSRESEKGLYWESGGEIPLGLGHGPSGISLFLLYLYLASGREKFLAAGIKGLDYDLSCGVETRDGGLSWRRKDDQAKIIYPYWQYGSAGIGMALIRYQAVLGGERYKDFIEKIFLDLNRKYAVFPGLFIGLAGLGETLLDFHRFTGDDRFLRGAYRVATGLKLFRINRPEGIAFPGDGLSKICCDLATGSAGVGRFFYRLVHRGPTPLVLDELLADRAGQGTVSNELVAAGKHR